MTFEVVDLYAGPGGWDEGMRMLGMTSVVGIEWDHAACLTATAAGHRRIRADVSQYCIDVFAGVKGVIASPPCQAWSMAGKRQGEVDRAKVHALVDAYANGRNEIGDGWADERSHHAAQPVRWIRQLRPAWVALEQVPPVLGLWQHVAERLRRWGYSTWTGVLNSADYGVPQTRERAILIARLDGPARPPEPTHARTPGDLDLFGGQMQAWVSMAEALGFAGADRPARTIAGTRSRRDGPGWVASDVERPDRDVEEPAPTLTGEAHRWVLRNGSQDNACLRTLEEPAGTMLFGHHLNEVRWYKLRPGATVDDARRAGRPVLGAVDAGETQFEPEPIRIQQAEAAVLQSFRPDYPWAGNKTKQFEQIGNAVPPLLAAHIIAAITGAEAPV